MRSRFSLLLTPAIVVAVTGIAVGQDWLAVTSAVGHLEGLHRVTEKPYRMLDTTALLCMAPRQENPHKFRDPNRQVEQPKPAKSDYQLPEDSPLRASPSKVRFATGHYCHVYTDEQAKPIMLSGEGEYPVGSLIVKAKLAKPDAEEASLYTVMRKREAGYDPEHGDWEYSVLGADSQVLAQGKIASCIDCHQGYAESDYVTRTYLGGTKPGIRVIIPKPTE